MLNKKKKIAIGSVLVIVILGIILIGLVKEDFPFDLDLNSNQKLIDYAFDEHWLFAIIEEKHVIDQERYIYIYKSNDFLIVKSGKR